MSLVFCSEIVAFLSLEKLNIHPNPQPIPGCCTNQENPIAPNNPVFLSQSSSFTFGLEQTQNVVFADWALDVADNASGSIVHELDSDLSNTSTGTSSAQHTGDLDELDGDLA